MRGHLKRWYDYPPEIEKLIARKRIIAASFARRSTNRPTEMPHSYTLRY